MWKNWKNGLRNLNRFFGLLDPEFSEQNYEYESVCPTCDRGSGAGRFSEFNSASWRQAFNVNVNSNFTANSRGHRNSHRPSLPVPSILSHNGGQPLYTTVATTNTGHGRALRDSEGVSRGEILPTKVFDHCLSYLNTPDLQNCRLVCRSWKSRVAPFLKQRSCILVDGQDVGSIISDGCAEKLLKYLRQSVSKFSSWSTLRLKYVKESQIKILLKCPDFQIAAKSIVELELYHCELSWVSLLKILKHFINLQCFIDNRTIYKSPEPASAFERFSTSAYFTSSSASSSSHSSSAHNAKSKARLSLYRENLGFGFGLGRSSNTTLTSQYEESSGDRDRLDQALLQAAVGHEDLKCLKLHKDNCNKNTTDLLKLLTVLTLDLEELHLKLNPASSSVSIEETYEFERHLNILLYMNAASLTTLYFDMMDTSDIGHFNEFLKAFQNWNWISPTISPLTSSSVPSAPSHPAPPALVLKKLTLKFKYVWLSKSFERILIPLVAKCPNLEQVGIGVIAFKPESGHLLNRLKDVLPPNCQMEFALYVSDHESGHEKDQGQGQGQVKSNVTLEPRKLESEGSKFLAFHRDLLHTPKVRMTDLLVGIFHDKVHGVRELLSDQKGGDLTQVKEAAKLKVKPKRTDSKVPKTVSIQLDPVPDHGPGHTPQLNSSEGQCHFEHVVDLHIFTSETRPNFKSFDIPFLVKNFSNLTKFELVDGPPESYWRKSFFSVSRDPGQAHDLAKMDKSGAQMESAKESGQGQTDGQGQGQSNKKSKNGQGQGQRLAVSSSGFRRHSAAKVTDQDLQMIISTLTRLKTLMIFANMESVSDFGLTGLRPDVCKRMNKTQDFNVQSRNEFLGVSLSRLKQLEYLSLRGVGPNLTDVCVHWGFVKMKSLRTLIISRYTWLTPEGRRLLDIMYPESTCFLGTL